MQNFFRIYSILKITQKQFSRVFSSSSNRSERKACRVNRKACQILATCVAETYCAMHGTRVVWRCLGKTDNYQANAGARSISRRGTKNSMVSGGNKFETRGQLCVPVSLLAGTAQGLDTSMLEEASSRESLQTTCVAIICRRKDAI